MISAKRNNMTKRTTVSSRTFSSLLLAASTSSLMLVHQVRSISTSLHDAHRPSLSSVVQHKPFSRNNKIFSAVDYAPLVPTPHDIYARRRGVVIAFDPIMATGMIQESIPSCCYVAAAPGIAPASSPPSEVQAATAQQELEPHNLPPFLHVPPSMHIDFIQLGEETEGGKTASTFDNELDTTLQQDISTKCGSPTTPMGRKVGKDGFTSLSPQVAARYFATQYNNTALLAFQSDLLSGGGNDGGGGNMGYAMELDERAVNLRHKKEIERRELLLEYVEEQHRPGRHRFSAQSLFCRRGEEGPASSPTPTQQDTITAPIPTSNFRPTTSSSTCRHQHEHHTEYQTLLSPPTDAIKEYWRLHGQRDPSNMIEVGTEVEFRLSWNRNVPNHFLVKSVCGVGGALLPDLRSYATEEIVQMRKQVSERRKERSAKRQLMKKEAQKVERRTTLVDVDSNALAM